MIYNRSQSGPFSLADDRKISEIIEAETKKFEAEKTELINQRNYAEELNIRVLRFLFIEI